MLSSAGLAPVKDLVWHVNKRSITLWSCLVARIAVGHLQVSHVFFFSFAGDTAA